MPQSIFSQEWRDCLCAHYTYVVRMGDQGTERTLRGVMIEAGFSDEEVKQLYVLATAHVDAVGADFVPDAAFLVSTAPMVEAPPAPEEIEPEAVEPEIMEVDEIETVEEDADQADEPPPNDEPDATQLSLF